MTVKILEKEGYKISSIGALIGIGVGVVALISTLLLYSADEISVGTTQIYQLTILILAGIVCPVIIFALSFLGNKKIIKSKLIPLIFGIIIIAIGAVVIIITGVYIDYLLSYTTGSPVPYITLMLCMFLGIPIFGACIYGGIQEILYWRENK